MSTVAGWVLIGPQIDAAFKNYDPENPGGTMDERSYEILTSFADWDTVQDMYKLKGQFYVYNLNWDTVEQAIDDIDYLDATWPPPQAAPYGLWHYDGRQVGTEWEIVDDEPTGETTGTPVYPIPSDCYLIMPDVVVYDENGDEVSRTPATSNADLRDINIIAGQAPRRFS